MTTRQQVLVLKFEEDMVKRSRVNRLFLAIDQLFNVLLFNGSQDETISSHIARKQYNGTASWFDNKVCCLLRLLEAEHCIKSLGE